MQKHRFQVPNSKQQTPSALCKNKGTNTLSGRSTPEYKRKGLDTPKTSSSHQGSRVNAVIFKITQPPTLGPDKNFTCLYYIFFFFSTFQKKPATTTDANLLPSIPPFQKKTPLLPPFVAIEKS